MEYRLGSVLGVDCLGRKFEHGDREWSTLDIILTGDTLLTGRPHPPSALNDGEETGLGSA